MSEVGASYRSRLLRSKRDEASRIVTSRKRKLREFFAVCDNGGPIPQISHTHPDAPPSTPAEAQFLEACDILQDRPFNESNLPTRRQLRSDSLKQKQHSQRVSPEASAADVSQKIERVQVDGVKLGKNGGATSNENGEERSIEATRADGQSPLAPNGASLQKSSSKSSQIELPAEASVVLDGVVDKTFQNAVRPQASSGDGFVPARDLESNRVKDIVESRPGSPGVDPKKAVPPSAEDIGNLPGPIIFGANDENHKAATAHLPPKRAQEARLEEVDKARGEKDDRDGQTSQNSLRVVADLASSPGSTIGAHSATTPALHEASTETSPENNGSRYDDLDRLEKDNEARTPPELKQSQEDLARKDEPKGITKIQFEESREPFPSSPTAADAQLRLEDEAASTTQAPPTGTEVADSEAASSQESRVFNTLPKGRDSDTVKESVERANDEAHAPTPKTNPLAGVPNPKESEVPDSEGEAQTPLDPMDVDTSVVEDTLASKTSVDEIPSLDANASAPTDQEITKQTDDAKASSTTPTTTPRRTSSATAAVPLERMTTRVASGAIRHKSVSEILGETPASPTSVRSSATRADNGTTSNSPSRASTPQSPRSLIQRAKEKERSRLSTVVFAKKPNVITNDSVSLQPGGGAAPPKPHDDYFMSLYLNGHSSQRTGIQPLDSLLQTAHKTITTSNAYVPIIENQTTRILKRIYNLQSAHKWSLRQPKRSEEPIRQTTHWDLLLQEAKWMRTDFREERKWKMAVARNLAYACAEWFEASPEERKILQVKATIPPRATTEQSKDIEMHDSTSQLHSHATPELVASGEADSPVDDVDEEFRITLADTVSPTAIFALQDDDVVFGLSRSPATDKLLEELPMYGVPLKVPRCDLPTSDIDPDRYWKRPAVPISKYVEGRMELKTSGPPHKKDRFEYEEDSEDEDATPDQSGPRRPHLPPEQNDVGLFDPANKHIRDRIHAGHQFRPPSEFPMPLQSFFENRPSSQWTYAEDDELKKLVREYSYNWSLISDMLKSKSLYSSGPERRTPWECFERWIALEGLPADMQKTAYFKAYNNRLEAAQRNLTLLAAQAPQQANANGQMMQARRRTTTSQRVEKRRNQKHLTLVDAMRKLAKKRENTLQKQQLSAAQAAARKNNEQQPQNWAPIKTPQEFSKLKHDREEQMKERMAAFQLRQEQQRREIQARARNASQQQVLPNGLPQRVPSLPNGLAPPNGLPNANGHLAVPGQNRARPLQQMGVPGQMPNSLRIPQAMANGVPQAPMQGGLPINPSMTADLAENARRVSMQQRQAILQRQQQQGSPHPSQPQNSPPRINGMPSQLGGFMPNNMIGYNAANASGMATSPGVSTPPPGQVGSPRIGLPMPGVPNGGLPISIPYQEIEKMVRANHPNASQSDIHKLIGENIAAYSNNKGLQQRGLVQPPSGIAQSAMNAAAGSSNLGVNGQGGPRPPQSIENSNPQMYAQMLSNHHQQRLQNSQQQQQQQQAQQQAKQQHNGGPSQGQTQAPNQGQSQGQEQEQGQQGQGQAQTQAQAHWIFAGIMIVEV
ncbi:hypothetical protein CJF32_00006509 [Rutstroemia sp. NJR-2017a WRK4]|nr:hypothetical protein CJF32_00006509 [Rutstroemia sp. NJR-2017a WRK4]